MKFYVISIILNIGILFIPIIHPIANEIQEEILTVNLENSVLSEDDNDMIEGSGNMGGSGGEGGSGGSSQKVEGPTTVQPGIIPGSMQTKENKTETIKNLKTGSSNNTNKATQSAGSDKGTSTSNIGGASNGTGGSGEMAASSGRGYGKGSGDGTGTGYGRGTGSGNGNGYGDGQGDGTGNGNGKGLGNAYGTGNDGPPKTRNYGCVAGKGYKINSKSKIELTKSEQLVIPPGTSVTVRFSFNGNGSVTVHGASGSNERAKERAISAVKNMKVTIIDNDITKCSASYTYKFN